MKTQSSKLVQFLSVLGLLVWAVGPWAVAQPTVGFHRSVAEVTEAQDLLLVPLELSQGLAEPGDISFSTTDGTALAGFDYTSTNGVLHIEAGPHYVSSNSAVLRISLLRDAIREETEMFFVHLRNPSSGLQLGSRTNLEVHILDNDQGVRFAQEQEVQTQPGTIEIAVLRGDDGAHDVTVEYFTAPGTALPGSDYDETAGVLVFHPGEASKAIQIRIAENDLLETDETFTVALTNATPGDLGNPSTRRIRILNGLPSLLKAVVLTKIPFAAPDANKQAVGIALQGEYAYMTYLKGMSVFNIRDPARSIRVADVALSEYPYGIAVTTNYAFIGTWDAGLLVMDIQQPSQPRSVAHLDVGGAGWLRLSGHYAYVTTGPYVAVVDIADPLRPVLLTKQPSGASYNTGSVVLQENLAFVAAGDAGLQIFDVIDPAKPRWVASAPMPGAALGVAVSGGYAYLTGGTNLLEVVSVTNPAEPRVITRLAGHPGSSMQSIFIAHPYAYVADYNIGLYVLNISSPPAPYVVATYASRSMSAAVRSHNIFLADAWSGLTVLSIAPTLDPSVRQGEGFQFLLRGLANLPVRIERSANLQDWELFQHLTPDREVVRITDSQPRGANFYRACTE